MRYRADGTPLSRAGVSLDAAERRRPKERRAQLANKFNHRIKNIPAAIALTA
jgi:two-component sensor histidine kinase